MNICATPRCIRPAQAVICGDCLTEVVTSLRQLASGGTQRVRTHVRGLTPDEQIVTRYVDRRPGLLADLEDSITRQAVHGTGSGGGGRLSEKPVPFHEAASNLGHAVRNSLTTWARVLLDQNRHLQLRDITSAGIAEWLARFPGLLAMLPCAGQLVDEVIQLRRQVRAMVDRAPDRVYLGICSAIDQGSGAECPEDVYGLPGRATVKCRTCGTEHDMADRRETIKNAVDDQLATAMEISRAMPTWYGTEISANTIRWWAHIGKLDKHPHHPHDVRERPRYRIGDVIELAMAREGGSAA